jgi:hypothetical protein
VAEAILSWLSAARRHKQREPMVLLQGLTLPWRIALESVRNCMMEADHDQV